MRIWSTGLRVFLTPTGFKLRRINRAQRWGICPRKGHHATCRVTYIHSELHTSPPIRDIISRESIGSCRCISLSTCWNLRAHQPRSSLSLSTSLIVRIRFVRPMSLIWTEGLLGRGSPVFRISMTLFWVSSSRSTCGP